MIQIIIINGSHIRPNNDILLPNQIHRLLRRAISFDRPAFHRTATPDPTDIKLPEIGYDPQVGPLPVKQVRRLMRFHQPVIHPLLHKACAQPVVGLVSDKYISFRNLIGCRQFVTAFHCKEPGGSRRAQKEKRIQHDASIPAHIPYRNHKEHDKSGIDHPFASRIKITYIQPDHRETDGNHHGNPDRQGNACRNRISHF